MDNNTNWITNIRGTRGLLGIGLLMYAVSFFLPAVKSLGNPASHPLIGYRCAYLSITMPWRLPQLGILSRVALFLSGISNPLMMLFLLCNMYKSRHISTLRGLLLATVPFAWIFFYLHRFMPQIGYFVWTLGILTILCWENPAQENGTVDSAEPQVGGE